MTVRPATRRQQGDTVKPYTDADVELVADAIVDARLQGHRDWTDAIARAVLDALAAAGRLDAAEAANDIEATGRCCCAGCVGMGPCDRELGRTDD